MSSTSFVVLCVVQAFLLKGIYSHILPGYYPSSAVLPATIPAGGILPSFGTLPATTIAPTFTNPIWQHGIIPAPVTLPNSLAIAPTVLPAPILPHAPVLPAIKGNWEASSSQLSNRLAETLQLLTVSNLLSDKLPCGPYPMPITSTVGITNEFPIAAPYSALDVAAVAGSLPVGFNGFPAIGAASIAPSYGCSGPIFL